jgi:hypothetical protein
MLGAVTMAARDVERLKRLNADDVTEEERCLIINALTGTVAGPLAESILESTENGHLAPLDDSDNQLIGRYLTLLGVEPRLNNGHLEFAHDGILAEAEKQALAIIGENVEPLNQLADAMMKHGRLEGALLEGLLSEVKPPQEISSSANSVRKSRRPPMAMPTKAHLVDAVRTGTAAAPGTGHTTVDLNKRLPEPGRNSSSQGKKRS